MAFLYAPWDMVFFALLWCWSQCIDGVREMGVVTGVKMTMDDYDAATMFLRYEG
jgi:hypothetical protein